MKCPICGKEIEPEKDKVVQVREGCIAGGEYQDFIPDYDVDYYHSGCFDGVGFPPRKGSVNC